MAIFIEQFLFRGRAPEEGIDPEWAVWLAQPISNPLTGAVRIDPVAGPLTPDQAKEAGYPLKTVLAGINEAALKTADDRAAQIRDLTAKLQEASEKIDALTAQVEKLTAQRDEARASAETLAAEGRALAKEPASPEKSWRHARRL